MGLRADSWHRCLAFAWFLLLLHSSIRVLGQSDVDEVHLTPRVKFLEEIADNSLKSHTQPFISKVDLVLVPVSVWDQMNHPVLGLDKKDFQIFDNKELQFIDHFSSEDAPISLAIVLDTSGSMASSHKMERAREAVLQFLVTSNPEDEVLLVSVADRPELKAGFTNSIDTIQATLVSLAPQGSTALLDGIYLAMSQMTSAKYARKALLIISDGGDNSSRYDEREITDLVKESDVLIYSIGLYDDFFQSEEERMGPVLLSDISDLTGGRLLTVSNPGDLADAALTIGAELRSKYVLGYRPQTPLRDGKWHKLRVKLLSPKGPPRVQISAKKGYYAPAH
jgi:Ca-activated chloride channel homolog